eukprot:s4404_g1.t1
MWGEASCVSDLLELGMNHIEASVDFLEDCSDFWIMLHKAELQLPDLKEDTEKPHTLTSIATARSKKSTAEHEMQVMTIVTRWKCYSQGILHLWRSEACALRSW